MRLPFRYPAMLFFLIFCRAAGLAQPNLSYSPSSNTYPAGTSISTLNITNSGSSVSSFAYGTPSTLGGTISGPAGIGTDASGNLYIANYDGNTISKYSSSGTFLSTFISSSSLNGPGSIVFDSSGNAYILSYGNGRVLKYSSSGTFISNFGNFSNPYGMAIDASDNIYVCDSGNDKVYKYSSAGSLQGTITLNNNDNPHGVVLNSNGDIFILLAGVKKVVKYNSSLVVQSGFSITVGSTTAWGLSIDGADNLYVGTSGFDNKIRIYNQSGTALLSTSISVTDPEGIEVGPTGIMYVSSYSGNAVYKYLPAGGYFINAELPAGLSFDSTTGTITGTPTTLTPATTYTVYGYRTSFFGTTSSDHTTVTITIGLATPTISGAGTGCSVTLTASGGSPSGGTYTWYNVSSGGTALATGSTYTASPGTYYVSYIYNGVESSRSVGATVTAGTSPVLSTYPSGAGLYLAYPFTNSNAADASSAGNTGTLVGSPSTTTDRYNQSGKAYSFNGSSQYITTLKQTASPGPANFSISVWFKTSSAGGMLVGFGDTQTGGASSTYDRHIYMTNAGQIYYGIYPGSVQTISTATSYADGNWHQVVATTSTTGGSFLYVDGAVVATDATMTTCQSYAGYWRIAYDNVNGWTNQPTNPYFTGSLDDIAIYKSALTASQVYSLYGAGSPPTCAGSSLLLQSNGVSGATYSWTGPNGFTSSSQNVTVTTNAAAANAGTYTLTVTSASGCATTQVVTAVVNPLPSAAFTATSAVTVGSNATVTYGGTYASTSTYTWDFGGGTPATGTGVGPYTVNWSTTGTKTITLTVTSAAGCSAISTQTVTVNSANYGNYGFKKPIALNTTTLGIMSDLTNFPALLTIQDNNLIISNTCTDKVNTPNGPNYDFAFTDANGSSEFYYQVESYNQTTGTLLVWVQIPLLTRSVNNSILFFYGSPSPTVTHDAAFFQKTWGSDYQAVYHFNESTYSGSVTDGSAGGHTGTAGGMSPSDLVTGKIGSAYSYNGSSKLINAGPVNITGSFTISAWVKPAVVNADQKIMTNQATGGSGTGGYKMGIYNNGTAEAESATAINRGSSPPSPTLSANTWYYVQGVFNGSSLSTYVNGSQYAVYSTTTAPSSTTALYIGAGEGGNVYYFNGLIDEARVSNTAKSADWLKAEYVNQNNPASFTVAGTTTVIDANAAAVPGALVYTWKGTTSTDVSNANNWDNTTAGTTNQLPLFDGTATLVIPAGAPRYPTLTGPINLYGLSIAAGASLNLGTSTLTVRCNIYNTSTTGQIIYSSTTAGITWAGTKDQTYNGSATSTSTLGSMNINNSGGTVTITGGPVDIYKSLTITSGNLAVGSSPAALTLKSTAAQTAYVGQIPSGSAITGTVKVERYITGGAGYRGYRLVSSPVSVGTDTYGNKIYSLDYIFNTNYVSGTSFPTSANSKVGNPCFYLYRENMAPLYSTFLNSNNRGIKSISNSPTYTIDDDAGNYNIPAGNGVLYFFRGGAGTTLPFTTSSTPAASTVTSSGTLNQGNIQVVNWYTPSSPNLGYTVIAGTPAIPAGNANVRGFNLLGNPYASPIDWNGYYNASPSLITIPTTGVNPTIYQLKPGTNTYGTYNGYTKAPSLNGGSNIIASGQGFFVTTTSASATLTFTEAAKTASQPSGFTYLVSAYDAKAPYSQYMILNIAKDTTGKSEILIGFNQGSTKKYNQIEDDYYLSGQMPQAMWITSDDGKNLVSKWRTLPNATEPDTIKIAVTASASGQYALTRSELTDIPGLYNIWLIDNYKKDSLDIRHNDKYIFNIDLSDSASYGKGRFRMVIRQDPALALHLLNFAAAKTTGGSEITWKTENEAYSTNFTVERSNDNGASFKVVGGYSSGNEGTYSLLDRYPPVGTDLYRLKMEDVNGTVTYSKTIALVYTTENKLALAPVSVYPNPARNIINVSIVPSIKQIPQPVNVSYNIIITGSNGNVVQKSSSSQPEWQGTVGNLLPGSYVVQVLDNKNNSVVGQSKFIKL